MVFNFTEWPFFLFYWVRIFSLYRVTVFFSRVRVFYVTEWPFFLFYRVTVFFILPSESCKNSGSSRFPVGLISPKFCLHCLRTCVRHKALTNSSFLRQSIKSPKIPEECHQRECRGLAWRSHRQEPCSDKRWWGRHPGELRTWTARLVSDTGNLKKTQTSSIRPIGGGPGGSVLASSFPSFFEPPVSSSGFPAPSLFPFCLPWVFLWPRAAPPLVTFVV